MEIPAHWTRVVMPDYRALIYDDVDPVAGPLIVTVSESEVEARDFERRGFRVDEVVSASQLRGAVGAIETALAELTGVHDGSLDQHERACLDAAVAALVPHAGGQ